MGGKPLLAKPSWWPSDIRKLKTRQNNNNKTTPPTKSQTQKHLGGRGRLTADLLLPELDYLVDLVLLNPEPSLQLLFLRLLFSSVLFLCRSQYPLFSSLENLLFQKRKCCPVRGTRILTRGGLSSAVAMKHRPILHKSLATSPAPRPPHPDSFREAYRGCS